MEDSIYEKKTDVRCDGNCNDGFYIDWKKEFPSKEITVVVPWNPGGTNDLMARALQPVFKEKFNVELVVKNSAGGGSAVGITEVLTSKPDGYTVGLASSSFLPQALH